MKHLNEDEVRVKLRNYIYTNHKNQAGFAKFVGVTPQAVSNILNSEAKIPSEWLELIGYESITIYKKVK